MEQTQRKKIYGPSDHMLYKILQSAFQIIVNVRAHYNKGSYFSYYWTLNFTKYTTVSSNFARDRFSPVGPPRQLDVVKVATADQSYLDKVRVQELIIAKYRGPKNT